MELLKTIAEYFGWAVPFGYAGLAYGFFLWLDKELSDEAKAALARTMSLKDYKSEQVASALVEVFDRIYTYPLLRWRAFFRSLVFTAVVTAIFLWETGWLGYFWKSWHLWYSRTAEDAFHLIVFAISFALNFFTDYLSLFLIRPLLIRSGTKPVVGLALGAVTGAAIVLGANTLRETVLGSYFYGHGEDFWPLLLDRLLHADLLLKYTSYYLRGAYSRYGTEFALPAMAVFVWLPLFALGIVAARLLTPLSWIVGRTQWFLKEGKEHPLKAIGYVAAVVVFLGTVVGRLVFSA